MTLVYWRKEFIDHVWLFYIVKDEQPIAVFLQPVCDSSHDLTLILLIFLSQVEQICKGHKIRDEDVMGISLDPENSCIVMMTAVGIFDCSLRLADTPQTGD